MLSPWIGILVIVGTLMVLMVFLSWLPKKFPSIAPEIPRKLLHVLMGLVVLSFPWLFNERWPVVVIAVLALTALISIRLIKPLKTCMGSSLHGVSRNSFGEIGFVISVALVFWFSFGNPILYIIPILVLTFADTVSAFIGIRYGTRNLASGIEDKKSFEGSFAFFSMAFIISLTCLLLFTNVGRAELLLISLTIGILVAIIEAISIFGSDNLFIPAVTFLVLSTNIGMSIKELIVNLAALFILAVIAIYFNNKTNISSIGLSEGIFAAYCVFAFGSLRWLIVLLLLFIGFAVVPKMNAKEKLIKRDIRIILANVLVPLILVLARAFIKVEGLSYAFVIAIGAQLCMNTFARFRFYYLYSSIKSFWLGILEAVCVILIPSAFLFGIANQTVTAIIAAVLSMIAAGLVALCLERVLIDNPETYERDWIQAASAFVISIISYLIVFLIGG